MNSNVFFLIKRLLSKLIIFCRRGLCRHPRPIWGGILRFVSGGERESSASSRRKPAGLLQRFRRTSRTHQNVLWPPSVVRGSFFPMQRRSSGERRDERGERCGTDSPPSLLQPRSYGGRGHAGLNPGRRPSHLPIGRFGGGSSSHVAAHGQWGWRALDGLLPLFIPISALVFISHLFVLPHSRGSDSTRILIVAHRRHISPAIALTAGFAHRSEHVLPGLSLSPGSGTQHGGPAGWGGASETGQERPAPDARLQQQLWAGFSQNPLLLPEHSAPAVHAVHHSDTTWRVGTRQQREGKRSSLVNDVHLCLFRCKTCSY